MRNAVFRKQQMISLQLSGTSQLPWPFQLFSCVDKPVKVYTAQLVPELYEFGLKLPLRKKGLARCLLVGRLENADFHA
jgi:hypothetical protein